ALVTERFFEVEPGTQLLAKCHWHKSRRRHPTLVLVHGLEGSSESPYMLGIAEKAFEAGFNVLRVNQRNCGGTEHLTPTLQNCGLSQDYRAILQELIDRKSTRLNSSHRTISYAVFCWKKKKNINAQCARHHRFNRDFISSGVLRRHRSFLSAVAVFPGGIRFACAHCSA